MDPAADISDYLFPRYMYIVHYIGILGRFTVIFGQFQTFQYDYYINISFPGNCYSITTRTRELGV